MRKRFLIPALMAFVFASCGGGGSLESDVRKTVKLDCEIEKLEGKDDDASKKKLEQLEKEKEELAMKLVKKYAEKMMDKDFQAKAEKIEEEAKKECGK